MQSLLAKDDDSKAALLFGGKSKKLQAMKASVCKLLKVYGIQFSHHAEYARVILVDLLWKSLLVKV
jgi:hypothetical protein